MGRVARCLLLCWAVVVHAGGARGAPEWPGPCNFVSVDMLFCASWQVLDDVVTFTMSAAVTGWVSVGFGEMDAMLDADMYTGWVDDNGTVLLLDTFGTGHATPPSDTSLGGTFDAFNISGAQTSTTTTITFSRLLNTADLYDHAISDAPLFLLWAYCHAKGTSATSYPIHSVYGSTVVTLVGSRSTPSTSVVPYDPGQVLVCAVAVALVAVALARAATAAWQMARRRWRDRREHPSDTEAMPLLRTTLEQRPTSPAQDPRPKTTAAVQPATTPPPPRPGASAWLAARVPRTDHAIGDVLVGLLFACANVAAYYVGSAPSIAEKLGALAAANSFLVVVPATRNSVLLLMLGLPFDRTIKFHRWLGYTLVSVCALHVLFACLQWTHAAPPVDPIAQIRNDRDYTYGAAAFATLVAVFVTALPWVRRRVFNVFILSHFLFLVFYVVSCFHQAAFLPYAIAAGVLYLADRLVRLVRGLVVVDAAVTVKDGPGGSIARIRIPISHLLWTPRPHVPWGDGHLSGVVLGTDNRSSVDRPTRMHGSRGIDQAGQYVFVNAPQVSLWEWHPFSVMSSPAAGGGDSTEVCIRASGNYTRSLVQHILRHPTEPLAVRMDGPYGRLPSACRQADTIVFVAGGIGLTPVLSTLKDIFEGRPSHHYRARAVAVVWSIRNAAQFAWFHDDLAALWRTRSSGTAAGLPTLRIHVYASQAADDASAMPANYGSPHTAVTFAQGRAPVTDLVRSACDKAAATFLFACGPSGLVMEAWDCADQLRHDGFTVNFHREVFEL